MCMTMFNSSLYDKEHDQNLYKWLVLFNFNINAFMSLNVYLNVLLILATSEQLYKILSARTKVNIYLLYDFGKTLIKS